MNTGTAAIQVFAPLGERLHFYESEKYLLDTDYFHIPYVEERVIDYQGLIHKLSKEVNSHNPSEVYSEAVFYEERIRKAIENLKPIEFNFYYKGGENKAIKVKTSKDEQKQLLEYCKAELTTYLKEIMVIKEARAHAVPKSSDSTKDSNEVRTIDLPENFKIKDLVEHFNPRLSNFQAAYFLIYLQEVDILPNYSVESMKIIAETIFARNGKNVTKKQGDRESLINKRKELE